MKNILLMIETDAMFLSLTLIISLIIVLFSIFLFFLYSSEKNKQKRIMFFGFSIFGAVLFIVQLAVLLNLGKEINAKITNIQTIANNNSSYLISIESEELGNENYLIDKDTLEINNLNQNNIKTLKNINCIIKYRNYSNDKDIEKVIIDFKE
jgi:hypothetical protein